MLTIVCYHIPVEPEAGYNALEQMNTIPRNGVTLDDVFHSEVLSLQELVLCTLHTTLDSAHLLNLPTSSLEE